MQIVEYIRRVPGNVGSDGKKREWCIFSHKTGKRLQCYPTKVEAEKALKRMQYFRHKKKDEVFGLLKRWKDEREKERLEKKWVKVWGTEIDKAEKWKEVIQDPEVAYEWYMEGFSPAEARRWISQGFMNVRDVVDWVDLGFSPREAKSWYEVGVTDPFDASEWEEIGLSPRKAREWVELGISPVEARRWIVAGFDPVEAKRWIRRGYSVEDVVELKARKVRKAEREGLGRGGAEKEWLYRVVAHIVREYRNERSLWEDLNDVAEAYGVRSVEALKKAFVIDWLKDVKVKNILVKLGKVAIDEGDVDDVVRELEVAFKRKGIDFDRLVKEVIEGK